MSPDAKALVQRTKSAAKRARARMKPWRKAKPTRTGNWYGAKWQRAGYYHLQRYTHGESVAYLRACTDEFWSGPYTAAQMRTVWSRFLPQPRKPR